MYDYRCVKERRDEQKIGRVGMLNIRNDERDEGMMILRRDGMRALKKDFNDCRRMNGFR